MTIVYANRLQGWRFILFNVVLSVGHVAVLFNVYRTSGNVSIAGLVNEGEQDLTIQDDHQSPSLAIVSGPEQAWTQTQLTEKNIKVILSRYYYRLPMADADRNVQLTHWHNAISEWYGQNVTTADYQEYAGIDEVLELGFGNYRIFEGQPSVQVIARTHAQTFAVEDVRQVTLN